MIINKNVAKTMAEHISCDCKCICSSTTRNSNQINNRTCKCGSTNYCKCKNHYSWNPSTCV